MLHSLLQSVGILQIIIGGSYAAFGSVGHQLRKVKER